MSATCGGCEKPIVWCLTESGAKMPVDPEPTEDGNVMKLWVDDAGNKVVRVMKKHDEWPAGRKRYVSHFATCTHHDEFRQRRPRAGTR